MIGLLPCRFLFLACHTNNWNAGLFDGLRDAGHRRHDDDGIGDEFSSAAAATSRATATSTAATSISAHSSALSRSFASRQP